MRDLNKRYREIKSYLFKNSVYLKNALKFGVKSPKFAQRIYINPISIKHYTHEFSRVNSGSVVDGNWDYLENLNSIDTLKKYQACISRWEEGKSWEDTGIYEYMMTLINEKDEAVDGCKNLEQIKERYEKLDILFASLKDGRPLKEMSKINSQNFNEEGGIYIHLGRYGNPIFGGGGIHRLAMSKILRLEKIPAQLGVLHINYLHTWKNNSLEMVYS